ncbi:hypothetical protein BX666DRAFT_1955828 [Dichotomocladium elegans]|nr:hypothetical protein BX666DRAFT_1955828 [Dichotomocladium elegans]
MHTSSAFHLSAMITIAQSILPRVPAHKHPQIAPAEFAAWIKNYTEIESASVMPSDLQRTKSRLSLMFTFEDAETTSSFGCTTDADKTHVFDRFSSAEDNSHALVPHTSRNLSRRSALSARGKHGHHHRRSFSTTDSQKPQDILEDALPIGGIQLYDRPVNMSEWVDLGDAMEDDSAMLTRVRDVESQVWTKSPEPPVSKKPCSGTQPMLESVPADSPKVTLTPDPSYHQEPEKKQTRSLRKTLSLSRKKSTGWLIGLFRDMSNKSPQKHQHQHQRQGEQAAGQGARKQSLESFIKQTLSLKPSVKKKKRPVSLDSLSAPPVPVIPNLFAGRERLPLHIERAIYHLSHIKLSNPRRPLCQQVVISNFMFWYLSSQEPLTPPVHKPMTAPPSPPPHRLVPNQIFSAQKSMAMSNRLGHIPSAYVPNAH